MPHKRARVRGQDADETHAHPPPTTTSTSNDRAHDVRNPLDVLAQERRRAAVAHEVREPGLVEGEERRGRGVEQEGGGRAAGGRVLEEEWDGGAPRGEEVVVGVGGAVGVEARGVVDDGAFGGVEEGEAGCRCRGRGGRPGGGR